MDKDEKEKLDFLYTIQMAKAYGGLAAIALILAGCLFGFKP